MDNNNQNPKLIIDFDENGQLKRWQEVGDDINHPVYNSVVNGAYKEDSPIKTYLDPGQNYHTYTDTNGNTAVKDRYGNPVPYIANYPSGSTGVARDAGWGEHKIEIDRILVGEGLDAKQIPTGQIFVDGKAFDIDINPKYLSPTNQDSFSEGGAATSSSSYSMILDDGTPIQIALDPYSKSDIIVYSPSDKVKFYDKFGEERKEINNYALNNVGTNYDYSSPNSLFGSQPYKVKVFRKNGELQRIQTPGSNDIHWLYNSTDFGTYGKDSNIKSTYKDPNTGKTLYFYTENGEYKAVDEKGNQVEIDFVETGDNPTIKHSQQNTGAHKYDFSIAVDEKGREYIYEYRVDGNPVIRNGEGNNANPIYVDELPYLLDPKTGLGQNSGIQSLINIDNTALRIGQNDGKFAFASSNELTEVYVHRDGQTTQLQNLGSDSSTGTYAKPLTDNVFENINIVVSGTASMPQYKQSLSSLVGATEANKLIEQATNSVGPMGSRYAPSDTYAYNQAVQAQVFNEIKDKYGADGVAGLAVKDSVSDNPSAQATLTAMSVASGLVPGMGGVSNFLNTASGTNTQATTEPNYPTDDKGDIKKGISSEPQIVDDGKGTKTKIGTAISKDKDGRVYEDGVSVEEPTKPKKDENVEIPNENKDETTTLKSNGSNSSKYISTKDAQKIGTGTATINDDGKVIDKPKLNGNNPSKYISDKDAKALGTGNATVDSKGNVEQKKDILSQIVDRYNSEVKPNIDSSESITNKKDTTIKSIAPEGQSIGSSDKSKYIDPQKDTAAYINATKGTDNYAQARDDYQAGKFSDNPRYSYSQGPSNASTNSGQKNAPQASSILSSVSKFMPGSAVLNAANKIKTGSNRG